MNFQAGFWIELKNVSFCRKLSFYRKIFQLFTIFITLSPNFCIKDFPKGRQPSAGQTTMSFLRLNILTHKFAMSLTSLGQPTSSATNFWNFWRKNAFLAFSKYFRLKNFWRKSFCPSFKVFHYTNIKVSLAILLRKFCLFFAYAFSFSSLLPAEVIFRVWNAILEKLVLPKLSFDLWGFNDWN